MQRSRHTRRVAPSSVSRAKVQHKQNVHPAKSHTRTFVSHSVSNKRSKVQNMDHVSKTSEMSNISEQSNLISSIKRSTHLIMPSSFTKRISNFGDISQRYFSTNNNNKNDEKENIYDIETIKKNIDKVALEAEQAARKAAADAEALRIRRAEIAAKKAEDEAALPKITESSSVDNPDTTINKDNETKDESATPEPAYAQLKRKLYEYKPTEPYIDENGDECLVLYEADADSVELIRRERLRSLINCTVIVPAVVAGTYYGVPTPYAYGMYGLATAVFVRNIMQVIGLTSFATKITAVWPHTRSEISNELESRLAESVVLLDPQLGNVEEEETEFQQRAAHNKYIMDKMKKEYNEKHGIDDNTDDKATETKDTTPATTTDDDATKNKVDDKTDETTTDKTNDDKKTDQKETTKTATAEGDDDEAMLTPGQPGAGPNGQRIRINPTAPDPVSWKFGWLETPGAEHLLFKRIGFAHEIRSWAASENPDFPEYLYIDRFNNGKSTMYQKVPTTIFTSVWSALMVPPVLPNITPELIEKSQNVRHDRATIMSRSDAVVTGLHPRFVKNHDAMNQIIFLSNINAQHEIKDKIQLQNSIKRNVKF